MYLRRHYKHHAGRTNATYILARWIVSQTPKHRAALAKERQKKKTREELRQNHKDELAPPGWVFFLCRQCIIRSRYAYWLRRQPRILFVESSMVLHHVEGGPRPVCVETRLFLNAPHIRRGVKLKRGQVIDLYKKGKNNKTLLITCPSLFSFSLHFLHPPLSQCFVISFLCLTKFLVLSLRHNVSSPSSLSVTMFLHRVFTLFSLYHNVSSPSSLSHTMILHPPLSVTMILHPPLSHTMFLHPPLSHTMFLHPPLSLSQCFFTLLFLSVGLSVLSQLESYLCVATVAVEWLQVRHVVTKAARHNGTGTGVVAVAAAAAGGL